MMPRGPKDEKPPADMIGMAGVDLFASRTVRTEATK